MSQWFDNSVILLRNYINDVVSPYTYEDSRLKSILLTSAYSNIQTIDFDYIYTINLLTQEMSPDPPESEFILLMVLRSVVLITDGEYKTCSLKGISIKDGPTSIDMSDSLEAKKTYAEQAKRNFDKAVLDYRSGNLNVGKAIIGPGRFDISPNYGRRFY